MYMTLDLLGNSTQYVNDMMVSSHTLLSITQKICDILYKPPRTAATNSGRRLQAADVAALTKLMQNSLQWSTSVPQITTETVEMNLDSIGGSDEDMAAMAGARGDTTFVHQYNWPRTGCCEI
jgi:hypothetical protein